MLGDSVTMGHIIEKQDTFANQLEQLLYTYCSERSFYKKFQIINAGVQGYIFHLSGILSSKEESAIFA